MADDADRMADDEAEGTIDPVRRRLMVLASEFHEPEMLAEPSLQDSAEGLYEGLPVEAVRAGMAKEVAAFAHFQAYSEVDEAEAKACNAPIIGTRWVFKEKGDGEVRARLVAQEFAHEKRDDVYAATPSTAGLRTLLLIAAVHDLCVWVADIATAFLHAPTDEDVFVRPPTTHRSPGKIWRLHRALCGLRKAPHHFQAWFVSVMVEKL